LSGSAGTRKVALAIDALRHGWPISMPGAFALLPAETGFGEGVTARRMLISGARAATLKLANQRDAAEPDAAVLIRGADPFDFPAALAVADPALDLRYPLKGPFLAEPLEHPRAAAAALELARLAGVLPAFLVDPEPAGEAQAVSPHDLAAWQDTAHLRIATRARLPIAASESAEVVMFRARDDMREHLALVIGTGNDDRLPLVRLHS
jgi:GTP cyclohydrolase II